MLAAPSLLSLSINAGGGGYAHGHNRLVKVC